MGYVVSKTSCASYQLIALSSTIFISLIMHPTSFPWTMTVVTCLKALSFFPLWYQVIVYWGKLSNPYRNVWASRHGRFIESKEQESVQHIRIPAHRLYVDSIFSWRIILKPSSFILLSRRGGEPWNSGVGTTVCARDGFVSALGGVSSGILDGSWQTVKQISSYSDWKGLLC